MFQHYEGRFRVLRLCEHDELGLTLRALRVFQHEGVEFNL